MTKSNIYETNWTDLVFENKNKEYGAYQLRHESSKNSVTALFMGLLLLAGLGSASVLINKFGAHEPVETEPTVLTDPLTPVDLTPIQVRTEPPAPVVPQQSAATPPVTSTQLVNPVVTATAQATPDVIAPNTGNHPVVDNTNAGTGPVTANPIPGNNGGGEVAPSTGTTNTPVNPVNLDKLPEFPGGMAKFYSYVGNNFNKPELDAERTLRVYVSFVIEKDGSITDIMVKNDPGYGIGKEAIRVLKSLKTKWSPGILNGNPVRTAYNLPITIKTEAE
ncbi:energy transducer TonB [Flavobacterium sp. N502536]|uniref:energy transducer TonB n=1 Tax=Flavobacterium sp. N502536 TaxID=2986837 RepID=UPI002221CA27|nr:energy transducer TonB [Flavobacterium sp. N502536]